MKILILGDVVGKSGREHLYEKLWNYRKENDIDFCVANCENASGILGLDAESAKQLLSHGVDVITGGNHIFRYRDLYPFLSESSDIIRPANYPAGNPGAGYTIKNHALGRVLVVNMLGTVEMESLACPFETADRIIAREKGNYDIGIFDIHAEATSEKIALGYYLDGRMSVVFGTHTHVATADERILEHGCAYITDVGMCGPSDGVLGVDKNIIIEKLKTKMPAKFELAPGEAQAHGIICNVRADGKAETIERVTF